MIIVELVAMPLMEVGGAEGTVHGCVQRNKKKSKLDTYPVLRKHAHVYRHFLYRIFYDINCN